MTHRPTRGPLQAASSTDFPVAPRTAPRLPRMAPPWPEEMLAAHLRSGTGVLRGDREGDRRRRNEQRSARRRRWHLARVESAPDPLSRASAASGYFRSAISRLAREDVDAIVAEFVDHTLYLIDRAEATEDGQDRGVVDERDDVDAEDR